MWIYYVTRPLKLPPQLFDGRNRRLSSNPFWQGRFLQLKAHFLNGVALLSLKWPLRNDTGQTRFYCWAAVPPSLSWGLLSGPCGSAAGQRGLMSVCRMANWSQLHKHDWEAPGIKRPCDQLAYVLACETLRQLWCHDDVDQRKMLIITINNNDNMASIACCWSHALFTFTALSLIFLVGTFWQ